MGAVPARFEEITSNWVNDALQHLYPGVRVRSLEQLQLKGHKPNKLRIAVEYEGPDSMGLLPAQFVLKGSFSGQGAGATGLDVGTEMEILGYRDIVPDLDVNTPKCFFVQFDPTQGEGILILEDLQMRGARFFNALTSLSYADASQFLDEQARLHSQCWQGPDFKVGGRLGPDSALGRRSARLHAIYLDNLAEPDMLCSHRWHPRCAALPPVLLDAAVMGLALKQLSDFNRAVARCLIHGDEHPGNLYMEADGTPGFLDWCIRPEPWNIAISYFLATALDVIDRRNWERALLTRYLEALARYGARPPPFEDAWLAYRCALLYPTLVWINNSSRWQPEAINTACAMRAGTAMIDHDTLDLLGVR